MASSKSSVSICALFLIFNLLFFTFGTSQTIPVVIPASPPANLAPGNDGQCPQLDECIPDGPLDDLNNGTSACCSLIDPLIGLEAATCLCIIIKALGIFNVSDLDRAVRTILKSCRKDVPVGFQCAPN
ncbi:hydrophobic seed protein-like [Dioscorea cayenensis subsp. rotundata]|uniref:Hydrophobic seed protein-like n=1 Tax=Dioscorea cayennensis subsp. rotundata TaxID=55577 RepID=A0AB40CTZ2_DIOCR|nr:hydrophobic seed protein-like [Dioscorea cayenensis subsp. rotundata]